MHLLGFKFNLGPEELQLPIKLLFPTSLKADKFMMLGLGDMAVPGTLVALCCRFDSFVATKRARRDSDDVASSSATLARERDEAREPFLPPQASTSGPSSTLPRGRIGLGLGGASYFQVVLIAYALALFVTFGVGLVTKSPMPALVFIVPCTLGSVLWKSKQADEVRIFWSLPSSWTVADSDHGVHSEQDVHGTSDRAGSTLPQQAQLGQGRVDAGNDRDVV